jgi:uncharacterized protein
MLMMKDRQIGSSMSIGRLPPHLQNLLAGCPTLGCLMALCDENYRRFLRLVPALQRLRGCFGSCVKDDLELCLDIREQTRYTTLVLLTYRFVPDACRTTDPDAFLRIYHDSRQVEVAELGHGMSARGFGAAVPTLHEKWQANWFLSKWLDYCLRQGQHFHPIPSIRQDARRTACAST